MKAATTSLYTYLKQHPDIFMPKVKETKFFNNFRKDKNFKLQGKGLKKISTFKQYHSLFKEVKNETAIGEASPSYIFDENCAKLISQHLPETRIIAILRQPVSRAYSNFLHAKRADSEPERSFVEAFEADNKRIVDNNNPAHYYKAKGCYYNQLKRYYNLFDKKQIKIILFEDIINNPTQTTQGIYNFLGVANSIVPDTSRKTNVSGKPKGILGWMLMKLRHYNLLPNIQLSKYLPQFVMRLLFNAVYEKPERLDEQLKKDLTTKHFKSDILKLEKLIEKDLSHWL